MENSLCHKISSIVNNIQINQIQSPKLVQLNNRHFIIIIIIITWSFAIDVMYFYYQIENCM